MSYFINYLHDQMYRHHKPNPQERTHVLTKLHVHMHRACASRENTCTRGMTDVVFCVCRLKFQCSWGIGKDIVRICLLEEAKRLRRSISGDG